MKKGSYYWHVYSDVLLGWYNNYDEEVDYIRNRRSLNEQLVHLRLFKPVKGRLPNEVIETGQAYGKAEQAYNDRARQASYKTWQAYDRARWKAWYEAWKAYENTLNDNKAAIEKLHSIECPNCPWDGNTIFPND